MSPRNPRKLLALSTLVVLILAAALGVACGGGSDPADQDFDGSDLVGLPDDDNGLEPAKINPNAPAAPGNLTAQVVSYNRIDLAWDDNSINEAGFKVYAKKGRGSWVLIARLAPGVETYQATGLKPGKTYHFKIVAYNSKGKAASNIVLIILNRPGMALIPSGCFNMGDAFSEGNSDELPVHNVCITSSFYMDVDETTNAEYAACVSGGGCTAPFSSTSYSRASYYGNPTYNNFPVIYISWDQATAYCAWAGKRLPTEAEWEYAARGGLSGKRYPWGNSISGTNANYWGSGDRWDNDTSPVGNYAANGYGLYDMTGNMWEWVNDIYSNSYYQYCVDNGIIDDPAGPDAGPSRVVRGGGWSVDTSGLRTAKRLSYSPTIQGSLFGCRCSAD